MKKPKGVKKKKLTRKQQRMVTDNLGLVGSIMKRFHLAGRPDHEDFFQLGVIGLMKAARTFDEGRGWRFSTHSYRCIRNEIFGGLRLEKKSVPSVQADDFTLDAIPERPTVCGQDLDDLYAALHRLKPRNRKIVIEHFGLLGGRPKTYKKMGEAHGMSKQRIEQIANASVQEMREFLLDIKPTSNKEDQPCSTQSSNST